MNTLVKLLTPSYNRLYSTMPKFNTIRELDNALFDYFTSINIKDTNYIEMLQKMENELINYNGVDWKNYVLSSPKADYLKCVYPSEYTHQMYAIIIISWNKDKYIDIHNHADNGCAFKILDGSLKETVYDTHLNKLYTTQLNKNNTSYLHNSFGFHSITTTNKAYSLHIYSPSNYNTKFLE